MRVPVTARVHESTVPERVQVDQTPPEFTSDIVFGVEGGLTGAPHDPQVSTAEHTNVHRHKHTHTHIHIHTRTHAHTLTHANTHLDDAQVISSEGAMLRLDVNAYDGDSGILACRWAVGTYPGGQDLVRVRTATVGELGAVSTANVSFSSARYPEPAFTIVTVARFNRVLNEGHGLLNGFYFYAWVLCLNNAYLFVKAETPMPFFVDSEAPVPGLVFDGLAGKPDKDYSANNKTFVANWRWWADYDSGIRTFVVGLGTTPGSADVHAWDDVGAVASVMWLFGAYGVPELPAGIRLYVTVIALDHADHNASGTSDGLVVDITPPDWSRAAIIHGLEDVPASRWTNNPLVVLVHWPGVRDPESPIVQYDMALSHTPSGDSEGNPDWIDWKNVGLSPQGAFVDIQMAHMEAAYARARCAYAFPYWPPHSTSV